MNDNILVEVSKLVKSPLAMFLLGAALAIENCKTNEQPAQNK